MAQYGGPLGLITVAASSHARRWANAAAGGRRAPKFCDLISYNVISGQNTKNGQGWCWLCGDRRGCRNANGFFSLTSC